MKKAELEAVLRKRLEGLPREDIEKSIEYYSEMIDERMEDAMTEEEAVEAMGSPDEIVSAILSETPLPKLIREKITPRRPLAKWQRVLLIAGSPLWLVFGVAAAAVLLAVYAVIWAVVLAVYLSALACALGAILGAAQAILGVFRGGGIEGARLLGAALVLAGCAILLYFLAQLLAKCAVFLGKKLLLGIKRSFVKKENRA